MNDRNPRAADPAERLVLGAPPAAFLKWAVALILGGSAAFLVALFIVAPEQVRTARGAGPVLLLLLATVAWVLLWRGKTTAATYLLGVGLWMYITGISLLLGGSNSMLIVAYPVIIMLAGWQLGPRAAVAVAALTAAACLGFVQAELLGMLPPRPPTPPGLVWIAQACVFAFSAIMINYVVRSYRNRLEEVRKLDSDLALHQAELLAREADLNRAQAVAHVGSWVYDMAADVMHLSAETCRIFGLPEGTTGNRDAYLARAHPEDRAAVDSAWQAAVKGGAVFDQEHRILVGEAVRWVRHRAELEFAADGTPLRSLGTTQDITERKQVEAVLQASEQRFRDLLQNVPSVAVQGYALDGTIQYWNRASERLYGYSAQEAVGRNMLELIIPPEMRGGVAQAMRQMGETGLPIPSAELSRQCKDGSRVPVLCSHALVSIPGRAAELFCIDIDLTERRRHEVEMLAARSQLDATFSAIPDLLFEAGLDGRFYAYHSPRVDLLAVPVADFIGKKVADVLPPDAAGVALAALREAHETGRSHGRQYALPLPQGRLWFELSVSRKRVDHGQEPRFIVLARDITERKRKEDEYRTIIQASADGFWITDTAGRILDANESICRMLGYAQEELLRMSIREIDADESPEEVATRTRQIMQSGSAQFQARHRRKDGTVMDVEVNVQYVAALGERLYAFVRDITGRKQAEAARTQLEAQLRESQKMEALGTLAGGVAHDFNNILAAIMGNAELARQDVGPRHAALESLEEILNASRRAKELVQQILAFGRRNALERRVMSLAPAVEESMRLLRSTLPAGVELSVECAPDAPAVLADATQVEQVLLNLCGNAWQAMQGQARPAAIEVRLDAYDHAPGKAQSAQPAELHGELRPGRYARLTVRDTGPGMDRATRARIFEPFFTTKPVGKGTGLGLAVVHSVVQEHGASIEVDSSLGKGTTFRIYFPAVEASVPAAAAQVPVSAAPQGQGKHIVYVDDDEAMVSLMSRLLERQGYRVSAYTDVRKALAAVRAQPQAFDLVVTDYNMPGMSGLEAARALREIRADLPVALASGYITEELHAEAPAAGVSELIYKANIVGELCEVVARLANAQRGGKNPA